MATQELLINEEIPDKEIRLIGSDGEQLGIVKIDHALRIAEEKDLDLVRIAPNANPPVCKIMDYGKARFEQMKREKEQRRNQATVETKEIRLSSTIDTHDMEVKAKACIKFLKSGNKVKASIRFRGRQISHGDVGLDVMNTFYDMVQEYAVMERPAKQEGRNMTMILSPKPAPKN
ncbi:MAG: translation initiation factor IF-3 [Clostridia bacterium]|nr:translation initiation factor IF-3 [Clostridia bacterium]